MKIYRLAIAFVEEILISNCCGTKDRMVSEDGPNYSDTGICPSCKEHCEFINEDEL